MMLGGNQRINEFFEEYGLTAATLDRYYTKAAEYYRAMLKAEAEGKQFAQPKPDLDEGREFFIQPSRKEFKSESFQRISSQPQEESGGFWSSASSFLSSAATVAGEFASEAAARVREQGIYDKVKATASSVYDRSKEVGSNFIDAVKVSSI